MCEYRLAVERSETEGGFHHIGVPDVDAQREGARFFADAVGHFPSFFSHTRPQNRKVQPPAEVKECATVLAGVRSSQCPVTRTCEYVYHNS